MSHKVPNWMVYSENPMYNTIWFVLQELGKVVECVCECYKYLHISQNGGIMVRENTMD